MEIAKKPCGHTDYSIHCWICYHAADCSDRSKQYQQLWGLPEPDCDAPDYTPPPLPKLEPQVVMPVVDAPEDGPGAELKKLLKALRIDTFHGCECESRTAQMNHWGTEGCRSHREDIVLWLRDTAAKRNWREKIMAAAMMVATGIVFQLDLSDPYGSLVDLAIRRAEQASQAPS